MGKSTVPRSSGVRRRVRKAAVANSMSESSRMVQSARSGEAMRQGLVLRTKIDFQRPCFVRQESWRYRRLRSSWRRPKGIDNKVRLEVKGWPAKVKVGHRGPSLVRGLHPSGRRDVLVHNINELERLSPERDAARLAGSLGRRKRTAIVSRAKELRIRVLNPGRLEEKERVST